MRLEIGKIFISDMQFSNETKVKDGVLYVCKEELLKVIGTDERIKNIDLEIAKPGDKTRIIPVKDVIEPRVKVEGNGGIFPGFISKVDTVGSGKTNVLKGAAVVTTGKIVGFQEGIIDMSGEGAKYTPFSKTNNLVVVCEPKEGVNQYEHEEIVRTLGFKAATYLGSLAKNITPDETKVYETLPLLEQVKKYPDLPKVVYVYMLQSQGLLHDTYVYGVDAKKIIPTFIYPTEVFDGAIVSGNCVSACDKNPSYVHMNHPVIEDLYEKHGVEYNFLGCVITNENVYLADKVRSSSYTAKLVEFLGADAVIISEEGFGNPDADLVMNCNKISEKGIKTVLITDEYAGQNGASQSLADSTPKGDAVVTGGNANEVVTLPPMEKIIGHVEVADVIAGGHVGSLKEDGSIEAEIQVITGATSEVGFNYLSAKGY
ncbi:glycine/sarcosine/betaine reductase component B subunit [Clostridium botulinum]|uniref:Glycine reductase complex component B subunits alpha and beta n=1 Tax=Clostridium botulinum (strain Langeland / NCTC 10281 / Type F) TaxID=441772 RepID=A7GCU7_CLOBL|nr:glycine/sarcosine/betaine reductase component B subunit [Clostridium botulinum]ABS42574.1 glycine reductase complex component B subunits alpha and beta [Clostridium botulinum F str. Langeland]ADF99062.1 glycine reductase complex component B subunits alpha and beta [Clostridium botulinum F str. 230613]KKM43380.1 beta-aspartyl peptidase [Clostridium botulinum]MBY6791105.1 glycine/sarcosine/betaine reductase component B subunit [Clostridium botulinum]MBY6936336.1 glycine/sarcosine/betaine redu